MKLEKPIKYPMYVNILAEVISGVGCSVYLRMSAD